MKYRLYKAKARSGKILPKWKAKFFRDSGEYFQAETLFTDKGRSKERAEELCRAWERQEAEKAAGIPQISTRPVVDIIREYVEIRGQKGKDGFPWSPKHRKNVGRRLGWWMKTLDLRTLADISLVGVEKALAALSASGETRNNFFQVIQGLVNWCIKFRYMPYNPLGGFQRFQQEAVYIRAAFTVAEVRALLEATPPIRRVGYQMALLTGMRHKELKSLKVGDLDLRTKLVKLSGANAKNRKEAWFYLPEDFIYTLTQTLDGKGPQDPLLTLTARGADQLHRDMLRAGLQWKTSRGVLDFHSFRATFATWLNEYGEDLKVIQDLMRHTSPMMTLNKYTKENAERRRQTVENLSRIMPSPATPSHFQGNTRGTQDKKVRKSGEKGE